MVPPNEAAAPERWQQIETLFAQARVLPPAERTAFLDTACQDPTLRAELDRLLASYDQADHFLDNLDTDRAAALLNEDDLTEEPIIGPYRLVREVGRGGMGTVYLAERATGQFQQEVALKLIKRGMDSDAILRRFLHERQILARLHHPSIARLYDGDMTDDGRPYFAMEYVEGTPITTYCDEHRLDIEARLRLFEEVGRAVQYAHQNLVVHRDLKPSNMLVTDKGELKLLDFGIARLLNEDAEAGTMLTEAGYRVMTPEYAAPEQVQGEAITTATDVYALGVVLYELLTGHRPYRFEQRTPEAIARHLAETEPERPSTVVRRAAEVRQSDGTTETIPAEAISVKRGLAPDRLGRRLSGDLDTVLLKALRKEPERRYPSAEAFLEDIKRHLNGLPVHARKDTMAYRTAKFIRRHTVGVVAAAAFIVLLAGFAVTRTLQQAETARERDKAEAVRDFVLRLFEVSNPLEEAKGDTIMARTLLERGVVRIDEELQGQPGIRAEMLAVVGNIYNELGRYDRAEPLLEQALALRREVLGREHPDVAQSLYDLAELLREKGNYEAAESFFREALAMQRKLLGDEHPDVATSLNSLGLLLMIKGDYAAAEPLHREALALRRKLLGPEHSDVAQSLYSLALLLRNKGDYAAAEPLFREALALRRALRGEEHPDVAASLSGLAELLRDKGDYAAAEPLHREALTLRRKLLGPEHSDVGTSLNNLALLLRDKGDYAGAEPLFREALAIYSKRLGKEHLYTSTVMYNLALVLRDKGDYAAAEPLFREALVIERKQFGEKNMRVAIGLNNLAELLRRKEDYHAADSLFRKALDLLRDQLPEKHPRIASALVGLGHLRIDQGRPGEAEPLLREALAILEQALPEEHWQRAEVQSLLGACLAAQQRFDEAEPLLLEGYDRLRTARGEQDSYTQKALNHLVDLYTTWGKPDQARAYLALQAP